uniref:Uncharacterized protein n=1 Tax=uncultured marine virus TaxID=186617 RepID=A0A0F7L9T4_9VIRU|nr:hypothetical protein [uncultured marine virus]
MFMVQSLRKELAKWLDLLNLKFKLSQTTQLSLKINLKYQVLMLLKLVGLKLLLKTGHQDICGI